MFSRLRALASESLLVTEGLQVLDLHRMATSGCMCLNLERCNPIKAKVSVFMKGTIRYHMVQPQNTVSILDISLCVIHCSPSASGAKLQSSVERPCPGENVTFTCTISSLAHQWSVPSLGIIQSILPRDQGRAISNTPFQFNVTEVMTGSNIISTATVTATSDLNGTIVVCQDGVGMLPDQSSTITIIGEHVACTAV